MNGSGGLWARRNYTAVQLKKPVEYPVSDMESLPGRTKRHPVFFIDIRFTKRDHTASKVKSAGRMAEGRRFGAAFSWAEILK